MRSIVRSTLSLIALGNVALAVVNAQETAAANPPESANPTHAYTLNHGNAVSPNSPSGPETDGKWFP